MKEKICPETGKPCLAKCSKKYCYLSRIVPIITEDTLDNLAKEAQKFSIISTNQPEGNEELAKTIIDTVKKKIKPS